MNLEFKTDVKAKLDALTFEDLEYKIYCHQDVYDGMAKHNLSPKTTMAIRQIIAFGYSSVAKGCSDSANKGWLRSPLGGSGGFHFYLWWTRKGSSPTKDTALINNDIVIRSIRHHDNHSPLNVGDLNDYDLIERKDLVHESDYFKSPWNNEQITFVNSDKPVRIAQGKPGSGKTTVLWEAVDLRSNQKVLYVTWSQKLISEAKKHFSAFAPIGTTVIEYDFSTIVSQICGQDIPRQTLATSRELFISALPQGSKREILGAWVGHEKELFSEIRAHFIGALHFGTSTDLYLQSAKDRIEKYGNPVPKVVNFLKETSSIEKIFPELYFSNLAIKRLSDGFLPGSLEGLTRIVVDEIQDLSAIELQVFIQLCKTIHSKSGIAPLILMAGDEGQTVRPSGFEWSSVNTQISKGLGVNAENIPLAESVRYPGSIAEVLDEASDLYSKVDRSTRPRKQSKIKSIDYRQAHLFHLVLKEQDDPNKLIKDLIETEKCTIICPAEDQPDWLNQENRNAVLTPTESKGLEYQTVCIINPGKEVASITADDKNNLNKFDNVNRRTRIDQLRVAISRATETLVFIDIDPTDHELEQSKNLLKNSTPFEKNDLIEHLNNSDITPEERVLNRINNAKTLIDSKPLRAWQLVNQAVKLLGESDLHNGVSDKNIRLSVAKATIEIGLRIIAESKVIDITDEILESFNSALKEIGSEKLEKAVFNFSKYVEKENGDPFPFLDSVESLNDEEKWFAQSISSRFESIKKEIQEGPRLPSTAHWYSHDVSTWFFFIGHTGDESQNIKQLRRQAIDNLINWSKATEAEKILNLLTDFENPDFARKGKIQNLQKKYKAAAKSFEEAEVFESAIDNWRMIADWSNASRVAKKNNIKTPDLDVLVSLENLIKTIPNNLNDRLHPKEKEALGVLKNKL
jgi:hypothetical protein